MAGSINKVILIGNLGRDPEVRQNQDGSNIITLSIATSESWKDKSTGERKERTEWHRVVVFNEKLGEICEKYLKKGSKVYLEGQLQTRKWTDQQGQEKYSTEIILGKFRGELAMLTTHGGLGEDYDNANHDSFPSSSEPSGILKLQGNGLESGLVSKPNKTYGGIPLNDEVPF